MTALVCYLFTAVLIWHQLTTGKLTIPLSRFYVSLSTMFSSVARFKTFLF